MKDYQVIITNPKRFRILSNGVAIDLKDEYQDLKNDDGYKTMAAARRMVTMVNKDGGSYGVTGDDTVEAVSLEKMQGMYNEFVGLKPIKDKAPKAKATKTPVIKDIHKITNLQKMFMNALTESTLWEDGTESVIWVPIYVTYMDDVHGLNPMQSGAMVSTLRSKGVITVGVDKHTEKKMKYFTLTELGKEIMVREGMISKI